jgi:hypothetical protein
MAIPNQIILRPNNNNNVNIITNDNQLHIISPVCNTEVNVTNPITKIVQVTTPGPQGPQGPPGSIPNTSSFASTGSNIFIGDQIITGSIFVTGNINGNLTGTASYALNFPTPFKIQTGSISAEVNNSSNNIFLIKNSNIDIFSISNTGIIALSTQSQELTGSAPYGGIYFTSSSIYVGLD